MRRGDNIPPVSDYAHWNEDAQRIWWEENKYDMQHWNEEVEDDYDDPTAYDEPDPDGEREFDTRAAAKAFFDEQSELGWDCSLRKHPYKEGKYIVDWYEGTYNP